MFTSARIKLTLWYLVIIMLVSVTFSAVIFGMVSREVDRFELIQRERVARRMQDEILFPSGPGIFRRFIENNRIANPELVRETKERIMYVLLLANGSIFVLAGWFGYVLAGRTLRPIQDMVDSQNRFVSDASHEFKTPLASLKIACEVYLRDHKRTRQDADSVIRDSIADIERLQNLTDSLLEISSHTHTSTKPSFQKLDMRSIVSESLRTMRHIANKKNITILSQVPSITLSGNKRSLIKLMVILLDNGIKYSHPSGSIEISAQVKHHHIVLSIKDHGIGISETDLPRIFDRFYRADTARSRTDARGNGLGLSIAREIVLMHDGKIYVESTLDQGSTVVVELPINHSRSGGI